jgi:predicted HicB family RNase H-like nuclease
MKNIKKITFCFGMLLNFYLQSEDRLEALDQKIKNIEALVVSMSQNMKLQQDLIQLLQKQAQFNFVVENDEEILSEYHSNDDDHRMTLRIPKSLMAKIDIKRKQRIGKISRNLWILETLVEATKK